MKNQFDQTFFEQASTIAKSLGNGRRMQLLELLTHGEKSVERLAVSLDIGITSVSAHLQVLKHAGLLLSRREGVKIYYSIADKSVALLLDHVKNMAGDISRRDAEPAFTIPADSVITLHGLASKLNEGGCTLIDVRPTDEYASCHIPGSLSVPVEEVLSWAQQADGPRTVLIYCRGIYCLLSASAMQTLTARGFTCFIYTRGISEWRSAGFPVEGATA